ncbi:hypothetical protein D3C86_2031930 [compost metagenome]
MPRDAIVNVKRNAKRGFEIELINNEKVDLSRDKTKAFKIWYGQEIPRRANQPKKSVDIYSPLLALCNVSL